MISLTLMIRRFRSVLFIDNDCLVNLLDTLYHSNPKVLAEVISILASKYDQIWIPRTIEWEFYFKTNDKKRRKILEKIMGDYQFIQRCPIPVSKTEIRQINGYSEENSGEVDAIIQINKAKIHEKLLIDRTVFLSQDRGAITLAKNFEIETIHFKILSKELREVGVIMPF